MVEIQCLGCGLDLVDVASDDGCCDACGFEIESDEIVTQVAIERIARRLDAAPAERRQRLVYSFRAAALRLGKDRGWLRAQADAGRIAVTSLGTTKGIAAAEVERIAREGIAEPRVEKRKRKRKKAAKRGEREAAVAAILAHPVE